MNATLIECGTDVEWEGKTGRVDLVISSGIVPGVEGEVSGTAEAPIARVVVGEEKVAVPVADLTAVDPEPEYKGEAAALVGLLAEHSRKAEGKGAAATLSPASVQTAFERGLHEWPGAEATDMSPDEWAVGRVGHLSKAALAPEVAQTQGLNDADLLDPSNPAYKAPQALAQTDAPANLGTGLSGSLPGEDAAPSGSAPVRAKPTLDELDFTGRDPEDPDGDTPATDGDHEHVMQADPGGDEGEDGNPDASAEGTTVNAEQMREMLGDWEDTAAPAEGDAPADET